MSTLQNITGTIALAGAGKMGGAMLTGWLAGGLDAKRVVVIEPTPSAEINALAAKGIRLNPKEAGPIETLVIDESVEKEQVARLHQLKGQRDAAAVQRALDAVRRVAATSSPFTTRRR